jgi:hypothetical protein
MASSERQAINQRIARHLKIAATTVACLVPAIMFLACTGLLRFPAAWSLEQRQDAVAQAIVAPLIAAAGLYALSWQWRREARLTLQTQGLPAWSDAPKDEHLPYR